jgi:hypothetical protein
VFSSHYAFHEPNECYLLCLLLGGLYAITMTTDYESLIKMEARVSMIKTGLKEYLLSFILKCLRSDWEF